MVKEVTSDSEFNSYISGSKLCVVDFHAFVLFFCTLVDIILVFVVVLGVVLVKWLLQCLNSYPINIVMQNLSK